ncbi:cytochrome P450 734A1 [Cinnamomum micranthum f. kanehirae]|uniref:Cytochrome P450 734A1 n=1 Tax=Cinnamomum micranthum f. kanehirae TaxID=337451 RepID=A0A3S3NIC0_9MAGN|nr:cytochrome P450 734A1 [Cinnamomum micranthum f. kanehirae]
MSLLLAVFLLLLFSFLFKSIYTFIWRPLKLQLHFQRQGLCGPRRHLINGNAKEARELIARAQSEPLPLSHDVVGRVIPQYYHWSKQYGKTFLYWFGSTPRLAIAEPEMVKEVLVNSSGAFEKLSLNPLARQLLGNGVVNLKGDKWAHHRKIANLVLSIERVKGWVPLMVDSIEKMLERWDKEGRDHGREFEVEVFRELQNLTSDIISKAAFGSSYEEGKNVFQLQGQQTYLVSQALRTLYIPGLSLLPTKLNRKRWRLQKEIRESLLKLIQNKKEMSRDSGNLIDVMVSEGVDVDEIIEECKTFHFAGKETSANLLTWTILLLAMHPEWQHKAREEVLLVCGPTDPPTMDSLSLLKLVGMILNESLRLYPPAVMLMREASKDVKLGNLQIPAGTQIYLPMIAIHQDTQLWGEDGGHFNPLRFSDSRKHLGAFFPFGLGARACAGPNLSLVESKIALAMILRRFTFAVSPAYAHAPMFVITLQPQHGVHIIFQKI